jgi:hypothetical protein
VSTAARKGNWIGTYSGVQFYPLDPRIEEVRIEDIAHALANQCRFLGHCSEFYSVAQHSVLVSRHCSRLNRAWGLLHDAAEAYLPDMPRPLKQLPEFKWYRDLEATIQEVIAQRFGLEWPEPTEVKQIDTAILLDEGRAIMPKSFERWNCVGGESLDMTIFPWSPRRAEDEFMLAFADVILPRTN